MIFMWHRNYKLGRAVVVLNMCFDKSRACWAPPVRVVPCWLLALLCAPWSPGFCLCWPLGCFAFWRVPVPLCRLLSPRLIGVTPHVFNWGLALLGLGSGPWVRFALVCCWLFPCQSGFGLLVVSWSSAGSAWWSLCGGRCELT